jgi:hypothetical protein
MGQTMDTHRLTRRAAVLALAAGGLLVAAQSVAACTLDQKATAFADGHLAHKATAKLTLATASTYAPFAFPGHYARGSAIHLSEDQAALRKVLVPDAMRRPWLWQFGDGTHQTGWTVTHRYARPGTYRISVEAYWPTLGGYSAIDKVSIVVTR